MYGLTDLMAAIKPDAIFHLILPAKLLRDINRLLQILPFSDHGPSTHLSLPFDDLKGLPVDDDTVVGAYADSSRFGVRELRYPLIISFSLALMFLPLSQSLKYRTKLSSVR